MTGIKALLKKHISSIYHRGHEIKEEKEKLDMRLYQAVENELGKSGKDTKLVDYLTDEIMKIRAELSNYTPEKNN